MWNEGLLVLVKEGRTNQINLFLIRGCQFKNEDELIVCIKTVVIINNGISKWNSSVSSLEHTREWIFIWCLRATLSCFFV